MPAGDLRVRRRGDRAPARRPQAGTSAPHGAATPRPDRTAGLPARPRHDDLGPRHRRARGARCSSAFVEAGGTLVDTADVVLPTASAERVLGSLIGDVVPRDEVVVATKAVGGASERRRDASRGHLLSALDASLRRLGARHVDLWQLHAWDTRTPLEETLAALDTAVASGRARYVGVSNYSGWQTARAATWQCAGPAARRSSARRSSTRCCSAASSARSCPAAEALGIGVLPWSPLGRGVLTGKYRNGTPGRLAWRLAALRRVRRSRTSATTVSASSRRVATAAEGLGVTPLERRARVGARPARRRRPDRRRAHGRAAARRRSRPRTSWLPDEISARRSTRSPRRTAATPTQPMGR